MDKRRWIAIVGALFVPGLLVSAWAAWRSGDWPTLFLNLGTEMVGAAVVYAVLERFLGQAEKREARKRKLIAQLGSRVHDVAVAAAEELRGQGWLYDGTLRGADLRDANLKGADLMGADLAGATLESAKLEGAHLMGADLAGAYLEVAKLMGAYLGQANLMGADLRDANLEGAQLWEANLMGVKLIDANLMNANLSAAKLMGADLAGVKYDNDTIWPEAFAPPEDAVKVDK